MGFTPEDTAFNLTFDDPKLAGFEVRCTDMSIGEFKQLARASSLATKSDYNEEELKELNSIFELFAKHLSSWNLEVPKGNPIPPTNEGIDSQPTSFILRIIGGWLQAVVGIGNPLGLSSNDIKPSPELTIPMMELS